MNIGETLVFKGSAGANAKCIKAVGAAWISMVWPFLFYLLAVSVWKFSGGGVPNAKAHIRLGIRGNAEESELHTLSNVTCDFG